MNGDVWVLAEQKDGRLHNVTLELLGEGKNIATETKSKLCAVLLGHQVDKLIDPLAHYGADKVFAVEHESLALYNGDAYLQVLTKMIQEHSPSVFLVGATPSGRDLVPRLGVRCGSGVASNCDVFKIGEEGSLLQRRLTLGSRFSATVVCPDARPQIATVRPRVIDVEEPDLTRGAEIIRVKPEIKSEEIRTTRVSFIKGDPKTIDLAEAEVVVSVGRGVRSKEGMKMVEDLADCLGGPIGGTRAAVDIGLIPVERQIGQTGRTVTPRLYVACGISGMMQHMAGMKNSEYIIAINNDPQAPIFKVAKMGILGDLHQVVPVITKKVKEFTSKGTKIDLDKVIQQ